LRKRAYFGGIFGIPTSGTTHRGEDSMPFTRQGFREQSAKACAGAGDENHLAGIHAYHSLPVVTMPCCNSFDAGSKVWIQK
jgi:phosphoribosylcarboxyaminoimidazole (NCAIR) mutase